MFDEPEEYADPPRPMTRGDWIIAGLAYAFAFGIAGLVIWMGV